MIGDDSGLSDRLHARWNSLMARLGVGSGSSEAIREKLFFLHREPGRHYHNLRHVEECLMELDAESTGGLDRDEIALALWFHDAVYDPKVSDNEAASARLASESLTALELPGATIERVRRLILATDHRRMPETDAEKRIADIDLSILGSSEVHYNRYASAIRGEYRHVPEVTYRIGRRKVLRNFLDRPSIYHTHDFRARFENTARRNLRAELERL